MDFSLLERAKAFLRAQRKKNIWYRTMCGLAAVVVFVTTYMLILPAITMERETICGQEEHTHTETCYEVVTIAPEKVLSCTGETLGIHNHTDACYDSDQNLICGYADFVVHTHDENCYDEDENLVCGLPELKEHGHTASCYKEEQNLTCGQEESEGHQHSDDCYTKEQGDLICTAIEHEHDENCYDAEEHLTCTQEAHTHNDNCYEWKQVQVCTQEESTGHTHTDACYETVKTLTCDEQEVILHTHTEGCYDENGKLICGKLEVKEHQHTDECFEAKGEATTEKTLICEKEEHEHDDTCYSASNEDDANVPMPLADNKLPVTKISGTNVDGDIGASYDPVTDLFTTNVRIDFQFNASTENPTAGTVYTYTYPVGVEIPDDLVNKNVQDLYDGNKLAGTYQFIKNSDGTYSVQVIFNENYINEAGKTVTGYVQFEGSFGKEDLNDKGDIVVGADDTTVLVPGNKITYPKDETESYNIDVSKNGSWEQDGDKLVYTVYVRTTKGTPDPISLTDTITNMDGLTLGAPSVTVEKGTANYYYNDWEKKWVPTDNNNWSEVNNITYSYNNGQLNISLPKLFAGEKDSNNNITGEVYKITYTYPITDQTLASVSPENKVTVRAEDTTKGQTVTDEAESTVNVNKDLSYTVDKRGEVASDKPGYIKWTVTVNNNEVDITGATLTDEMLGLVESAEDISIAPTAGATVNSDGNITFSAVGDGMNKNKYTITYYTPVENSWDGTTVTNKAVLDPKPDETGDEKETTASVTVSGVKLDKFGAYNGSTNKIDWTITVNSGNLDIAGAILTDEMFKELSEQDFSVTPSGGYTFVKDADNKITGITFSEVQEGKNTQTYTIKYSTDVTENADGTISPVTNSATLSPGQGTDGTPVGAESTVTPETVKLTKSGNYNNWNGQIKWTITVNEGYRNIAGAVLTDDMFGQLEPGNITVMDGNWQMIADTSGQYSINQNADGKILSITFNAINDGKNTNKYIIEYSTTEYNQWDEHTVHNEAKLTLDGKDIPGTADVTIPGDGSVAKSAGTALVSADGTTLTIPWTVTLTIPKGGLAAGTSIVDDVTKNQWSNTNTNQWMSKEQIEKLNGNLKWNNGSTVASSQYSIKSVPENSDSNMYTGFEISFLDELIPPEEATELTFTYDTTADLTQTTTGQTSFYNYIKVGEKESSAEYKYCKPGVVKTDGNGNTQNTTVSNDGTLTWKIKANVGEGNKKLTLIDTLPEGVTLESLLLTGWGNLNMELEVSNSGAVSGTDSTNQYNVSGTFNNNVISLDVVPQTTGNTIQTGAEFTLTVTCKVNDAENQTEMKSLTNTAQMKLDGSEIGSSSQTQEWTYKKEEVDTKVVDKSGGWDNNNRIMNYTVILNKEGKELLEGSDTLTLIDTLSYENQIQLYHPFSGQYSINASLIQSSVKLYKAVWDESQEKWVADEVISNWSWTYEAKTGANDWDKNKATNTITATGIPDGIPLMLQYSYRITSNVPDKQNGEKVYFDLKFTNKATLEGTSHTGESSSSNMKWEHSDASAGVTTDKSYIFYKVEAGNYNVSLAGATFSVYKYNSATNDESSAVKTYSTNDSGSFHITRQEKDSSGNVTFSYDTNTLYKVVETAPPSGYKLPDVVNTYYFYFSSTEDNEHTLPSNIPSDAVDLSKEAKTVYVENVKNTTEITVEKKWQDSNGDYIDHNNGSVTVDLFRKTSQGSSSGGGESEGTGVEYSAKCNDNIKSGRFDNVDVGDTVCISVEYTWNAGEYSEMVDHDWEWTGVTDGNGTWLVTKYDYTCKIQSNSITFTTGDREVSIKSISCTLVEKGESTDAGNSAGTQVDTVTLNKDNGWTHTFTNLPLTGTDTDGNTVNYYYYVQEVSVPNYTTSYTNNGGIQSGTITVTNKATDTPTYELPETGGPGTRIAYTLGSILMLLASAAFLYIKKRNDGKKGGLA